MLGLVSDCSAVGDQCIVRCQFVKVRQRRADGHCEPMQEKPDATQ